MARQRGVPFLFDRCAVENSGEEECRIEANDKHDPTYDPVFHISLWREDAVVEEKKGELDAACENQVHPRRDGKPLRRSEERSIVV